MKFGTIGAGTVAFAFAREAVATGHEVVLSSRRDPEFLASKVAELGHGASAATVEEAASLDYVLLAVPWPNVEDALRRLPAWNGRVLIDATNPFIEYSPKLVLAELGGKGASEVVAGLAPGARVVKAFNSIVTARFRSPSINASPIFASSAAILRKDRRLPFSGLARPRRFASRTTAGCISASDLRPSHLPCALRLRSRAPRSLATVIALSNSAIHPAWRNELAVRRAA